MLTLATQQRDPKENLEVLRTAGRVPAVYYGAGKDAISISLDHKEAVKMYKDAGQSTLITLKTAEGDTTVLLHDYQVDAVTQKLLHMDFLIIDTKKPIEVSVALNFIGEAPAEKNGLGLLTKVLHEIEIEVSPLELPPHLDVDVSGLENVGDALHVRDLTVPEGVELRGTFDAQHRMDELHRPRKQPPLLLRRQRRLQP